MFASLHNRPALGFALGVAFVVAALVQVARLAPAPAGVGCPMVESALDEGYGVTRTGLRPVCGR